MPSLDENEFQTANGCPQSISAAAAAESTPRPWRQDTSSSGQFQLEPSRGDLGGAGECHYGGEYSAAYSRSDSNSNSNLLLDNVGDLQFDQGRACCWQLPANESDNYQPEARYTAETNQQQQFAYSTCYYQQQQQQQQPIQRQFFESVPVCCSSNRTSSNAYFPPSRAKSDLSLANLASFADDIQPAPSYAGYLNFTSSVEPSYLAQQTPLQQTTSLVGAYNQRPTLVVTSTTAAAADQPKLARGRRFSTSLRAPRRRAEPQQQHQQHRQRQSEQWPRDNNRNNNNICPICQQQDDLISSPPNNQPTNRPGEFT